MALSVRLTSNSSPAISYRLNAETFTVNYTRSPLQASLGAGLDPIIFDLGMFKPAITISGTLLSTAGSDGGVVIPSQNNLEDFVKGTSGSPAIWKSTVTISVVIGGITNNYVGSIQSCNFSLQASREDLWEFRMQLVTVGRS